MKRSKINEWVKALRSGKYKQGTGYLQTTDNEYCCVGVLCKTLGLNQRKRGDGTYEFGFGGVWDHTVFPDKGLLHFDIKNDTFSAKTRDGKRVFTDGNPDEQKIVELTSLNDEGYSFLEIADIIEKNPEWFFDVIEEDAPNETPA